MENNLLQIVGQSHYFQYKENYLKVCYLLIPFQFIHNRLPYFCKSVRLSTWRLLHQSALISYPWNICIVWWGIWSFEVCFLTYQKHLVMLGMMVYINDLPDSLTSKPKFFAGNMPFFSSVTDSNATAYQIYIILVDGFSYGKPVLTLISKYKISFLGVK